MCYVLWHFPKGYPRTQHVMQDPRLKARDKHYWRLIVEKQVHPTAEALAAFDGCNKDTAAASLRRLEEAGYCKRWMRSGGHKIPLNLRVFFDHPDAYGAAMRGEDLALAAKIIHWEEQVVAAARDTVTGETWDNDPQVPPPRRSDPELSTGPLTSEDSEFPQVNSQLGLSEPKNPDATNSLSSREVTPPTPSQCEQTTHKADRYTRRLTKLLTLSPELDTWVPSALAILGALDWLTPMERARHAGVVAEALRSGIPAGDLVRRFASGMESARDWPAVTATRVRRLAHVLKARE
jgi:hypothetical protein